MTFILPDWPWDALRPHAARASEHRQGLIDLSVGSPVDPTPAIIREALATASDAHGYPMTVGSPALRESIVEWFSRRRGVDQLGSSNVLPTIGSKEFIAGLALWCGISPGDVIVQPALAYPTYAVGAALVGATIVSSDQPAEWPEGTKLIWINSPGNPNGRILDVDELIAALDRARELGAIIASDECYAEFGWDEQFDRASTVSILDPRVLRGDDRSVLCVASLSKQSNLAGYRAGFVAGDSNLIDRLVTVRKHLGVVPPAPIQAAMIAALGDDSHVRKQKALYRARRNRLLPALQSAGLRIDDSEGGLYLWATAGTDAWQAVGQFAELGILVVPGTFYGQQRSQHVRVALTATDTVINAAVDRLAGFSF